jgi:hypothetical protein
MNVEKGECGVRQADRSSSRYKRTDEILMELSELVSTKIIQGLEHLRWAKSIYSIRRRLVHPAQSASYLP